MTNSPARRNFMARSVSSQPELSAAKHLKPFTPVQTGDQHVQTWSTKEDENQVASQVIEYRPYQQDSLEACLSALERGVSRIGVSLPTGSGKTSSTSSHT
ncbi:hypothetical protein Pst134EA_007866 [Puccinia striiformis f. sp. tritici]|uniref:hypothetical protein n=1 Tax=Puccinia striiformis f. sp. tritici TaxID=168172 RepID=UPI002008199C|nr:hypothetical protein Pst134EA_007866 [Puccinia striiformis f. sp. tritici]KAH9470619.1 hypothetical protein Pst134EA_007866 [Puccinia striiformis f. sp. tritici]